MADFVNNAFIIPRGRGKIVDITFEALLPTATTGIRVNKDRTIVAAKGKNILGKTSDLIMSIK